MRYPILPAIRFGTKLATSSLPIRSAAQRIECFAINRRLFSQRPPQPQPQSQQSAADAPQSLLSKLRARLSVRNVILASIVFMLGVNAVSFVSFYRKKKRLLSNLLGDDISVGGEDPRDRPPFRLQVRRLVSDRQRYEKAFQQAEAGSRSSSNRQMKMRALPIAAEEMFSPQQWQQLVADYERLVASYQRLHLEQVHSRNSVLQKLLQKTAEDEIRTAATRQQQQQQKQQSTSAEATSAAAESVSKIVAADKATTTSTATAAAVDKEALQKLCAAEFNALSGAVDAKLQLEAALLQQLLRALRPEMRQRLQRGDKDALAQLLSLKDYLLGTSSSSNSSNKSNSFFSEGMFDALLAGLPLKKQVFVLRFKGDMQASQVSKLREEVTAVLQHADIERGDEVVVLLDSGGGTVTGYGLAAAQLARVKSAGLLLTVCVDEVAASGGYMMAAVAHQITASPFALIGSIGVVASMPNFSGRMQREGVGFEEITAGRYKRTLSPFKPATAADRSKLQQDLEVVHRQFKDHLKQHRPSLAASMESLATGETWFGEEALKRQLVDELCTSDEFLSRLLENGNCDVFTLQLVPNKSPLQLLLDGDSAGGFGASATTAGVGAASDGSSLLSTVARLLIETIALAVIDALRNEYSSRNSGSGSNVGSSYDFDSDNSKNNMLFMARDIPIMADTAVAPHSFNYDQQQQQQRRRWW